MNSDDDNEINDTAADDDGDVDGDGECTMSTMVPGRTPST